MGTLIEDETILEVRDLVTRFYARFGTVYAVEGVSFRIRRGETLGLVGESGSGKSVTAMSIMRLLSPAGRIVSGDIRLRGKDVLALSSDRMREVRGDDIAMVFQNPMTALNPALKVGWQLREVYLAHAKGSKDGARRKAIDALKAVGIPNPELRASAYPHEFSGGMRQRIVLAMGMMNDPDLLIADEPTTALDVTIQAQVLELMKRLTADHGMALLLITHNMGVVANMCDRVAVMYAGEVVEEGTVDEIFADPRHPYTWALLKSLPSVDRVNEPLPAIRGVPPMMTSPPVGCRFRERCPFAEDICHKHPDLLDVEPRHASRCWVAQRGKRFGERDVELLAGGTSGQDT